MAAHPEPAPLLAAYLAVGTDELKKRHLVERMDERLERSGGDPTFNRDEVDGARAPEPALLRSSLDTLPFGADFRLVVVRDVDKAPKPFTEAVVAYLDDPNPQTVLLMTAAKQAKNTRLYKAVAKLGPKAVIDCTPKKRWELPQQVVGMAHARGAVIDADAADLLVRLVGESTLMLDNELAKLAGALGPGAHVRVEDVRRLVPRTAEVKPWDFLDAVSARKPAEALRYLAQMPSQSPYALFSLTLGRLRELVAAKALAERGCPGTLAAELGLQQWQVKNHAAWARCYSMGELTGALSSAADCDEALKSSPDKDLVFQRWLLSWCTPRA
jgi:DNA polymerase-3 subunit delta